MKENQDPFEQVVVEEWQRAAERGDPSAQFDYACLLARELSSSEDGPRAARMLLASAIGGNERARQIREAAGSDEWPDILAELLITLALDERSAQANASSFFDDWECDDGAEFQFAVDCPGEPSSDDDEDWDVAYAVSVRDESGSDDDSAQHASSDNGLPVHYSPSDISLLETLPDGAEIPAASGRQERRVPDLRRTNPSFAALLLKYVRDRFDSDAPQVYRAAGVSRKTYSAIVGNELRPVAKRTAVAFAFALKLSPAEAEELLRAAGYALSSAILEDIVFSACLRAGIHDLVRVNAILARHGADPLSDAKEG